MLADALPGLPVPPGNRLLFEVVRHGSVMGTHRLDFASVANRLVVTVNVQMALSFGPIPLFHYAHHAVEQWEGDQCIGLKSQTDHNGTQFQVLAQRDAIGWQVAGSQGKLRASPDALPATHWNRKMLQGPMINTETGSIMHPKIADLGEEMIPAWGGSAIRAEHYEMSGDAQMDTWYDDFPSWAGAQFLGGDGSLIRYVRVG